MRLDKNFEKKKKKDRYEQVESSDKKRVDEKTNSVNHTTRVISFHTEKTGASKHYSLKLYKESW